MSIPRMLFTFLASLFKSQRQLILENLALRQQATNMGWGAPRIHGELLKLGIDVSQATVSKYMLHLKKPPSQTWRTFLDNHADCLDHVIVLNERHLRRILREYFSYYHTSRIHLSLNKDPPEKRPVHIYRRDSCRYPGCTHEKWLDAHHVMHWADGGETSLDNTVLLCSRHHRLLHEGVFAVKRDGAGQLQFGKRRQT